MFGSNFYESDVITLDSGKVLGQGINVGPGKFITKNKHMALN